MEDCLKDACQPHCLAQPAVARRDVTTFASSELSMANVHYNSNSYRYGIQVHIEMDWTPLR